MSLKLVKPSLEASLAEIRELLVSLAKSGRSRTVSPNNDPLAKTSILVIYIFKIDFWIVRLNKRTIYTYQQKSCPKFPERTTIHFFWHCTHQTGQQCMTE
jgi:hypothetical protein